MNSQLERMLARRLDPKFQYVTAPISQCHNNIGLRDASFEGSVKSSLIPNRTYEGNTT